MAIDNRLFSNSKVFAKLVAFLKLLANYACDYFSPNGKWGPTCSNQR